MPGPSKPNRVSTPSSFATPSASPGATPPTPDGKWTTGSEWAMIPSTSSSRAPSPNQLVQRPTHQMQMAANVPVDQVLQLLAMASQGRLLSSPFTSLQMAPTPTAEGSASRPTTPEPSKRSKRIPRPPNAFMLYRSNLIKTGRIPKSIEQRQQHISRVAGECWNLLTETEKEVWHLEAQKTAAAHQLKHPDYKFSPARKASRRKTATEDPPVDKDTYVRHLREKYIGIYGDAKPPPRPRKAKSRRGVGSEPPPPQSQSQSLPSSLHPSPSSSPVSFRVPSAPPSLAASPAPLQPAHVTGIPGYTLDELGILPIDVLAHHVATTLLQPQLAARGDDVTTKASTFGDIALPTQPNFNFPGSPSGSTTAEDDLGLARQPAAGPSQQAEVSRPPTPSVSQWDSFLKFPDPLTAQIGASLEGHDDPNSLFAYGEFNLNASTDSFTSSLSLFSQSE